MKIYNTDGNEWEPMVTKGRNVKAVGNFERYVLQFVINGNSMMNHWKNSNGIFHHSLLMGVNAHIAQNIAETCQKYFQSFIAIEMLPQHFCQLFQNISLQHYNFNFLKYFCE